MAISTAPRPHRIEHSTRACVTPIAELSFNPLHCAASLLSSDLREQTNVC
ncbi:hypothetical protein [Marinomonas ostreistagni]|nr:hypothetical protein [Marinomonas ostreistagni]MBM6551043.1 hypothetical protein [Marinomonas ostreistagni]